MRTEVRSVVTDRSEKAAIADAPSATLLVSLRDCFSGRLLTGDDEVAQYVTDWRGKWHGTALAVVQPDTATDVANVLRWCHAHRVPVVPQGGNTGLSGGSVPDGSGRAVVLSLSRLNRIRSIDAANLTLVAEAGCTLQQVQDAARKAGRLFPLSLAAQGSCTIGGNLATNAGGVHVLRYGNARELCLGLEVATAEGQLWDGLRALRKDNTGYALRDLFIGSEGSLGVITAAVLKLFPQPASTLVSLVAVPSPDAALALLELARAHLGTALSAFELFSEACVELVLRHIPDARRPLDSVTPWYVLVELSDTRSDADAALMFETLLGSALEQEIAVDATISTSLAQAGALWALRENISEAQAAEGSNIKHDISLPISRIPEFIASTGAAIAREFPTVSVIAFGHLGDGNLHYNVSPAGQCRSEDDVAAFIALEGSLNRMVHDAVAQRGGSISAEHGLGVLRRDEAVRYRSPLEHRLMQRVKEALDPFGLMNPGKLLAEPRLEN